MIFFSLKIIKWYVLNKRELPWRNTSNPYYIWLSEIILQQTRVEQGLPYYQKFVRNYPDIFALANAPEEDVLRDWQGLGYYSRARNLHATAKIIVTDFGGIFPSSYAKIRHLRGVGDYTAAAIASFAFHIPVPAIDGNVYRVITRFFGVELAIDSLEGKKMVAALVNEVFDKNRPALFNQAIMEFGALQCKPVSPDCSSCVLQEKCEAFAQQKVALLPIKQKKTKVRSRFFNFFVVEEDNFIWIEQRTQKDIWQHLFQFPLIETVVSKPFHEVQLLFEKEYPALSPMNIFDVSPEIKHVLSHQHIYCRFIHIQVANTSLLPFTKISKTEISDLGFPIVLVKYMKQRKWLGCDSI